MFKAAFLCSLWVALVLLGGAEGVLSAANLDPGADPETNETGETGETSGSGETGEENASNTDADAATVAATAASASAKRSQTQKVTTAVGAKRANKLKGKPMKAKAKSLGKKNANTLSFGDEDEE